MAKIELKDLIKNKKLTDKVIDGITKSFVDSVKKDIEETIKSVKSVGITIRDLKESDKWLGATLSTVVNATKFNSKAKEVALQIVRDDKTGDFIESFEDTVISVDYNRETKSGLDGKIETVITIKPTSIGPSGELVAQMLNAAFYGGEVRSPLTKGGENEVYVFNATPGHNQAEIDRAADKLRDFFYKQHKDEIAKKFEEELEKFSKGI